MRATRDVVYSACSFFGLPVRNVWNGISGQIRRFFSGAGKVIDNVFYPTYASEFGDALEAGDESKAYAIMQILTGDRLDGAEDAVVHGFNALNKTLHTKGQAVVLPATAPATFTVNGKKIEFTGHQQNEIQAEYAKKAEKDFKRLFSSSYKSMTTAQKRAAINAINDMRMHEAIEKVTNTDTGDTNILLAKATSTSTFAQYKGVTYGIKADKDMNGNAISGSKRKKVVAAINKLPISDVEKLILILAAGFSLKSNDVSGIGESAAKTKALAYIVNSSSLTQAEKLELAEKLGFEVKNGKITGK
jgi:hypothetical protein